MPRTTRPEPRTARDDPPDESLARFEAAMLPLMDDAYTVARYLVRDEHDAQDIVQEAYLRALRYFDGFRGATAAEARAWLLTIVRNVCHTWRQRNRAFALAEEFDESRHTVAVHVPNDDDRASLLDAVAALPREFREALVLRDVQGLAYKEIAQVLGVPIGTVMSRLARARGRMRAILRIGEAS